MTNKYVSFLIGAKNNYQHLKNREVVKKAQISHCYVKVAIVEDT